MDPIVGMHPLMETSVSKYVSPVMLVFDGEANGYRNHILPMAAFDETLRRSVSVAAAFHLQSKMPELRAPAEGGREVIIQKLRRLSDKGDPELVFNESTWATILLLIVGDLITGHEDILVLYRMLQTFLKAWGTLPSGSYSTDFMRYQSKL
jgi:hypothetical protein